MSDATALAPRWPALTLAHKLSLVRELIALRMSFSAIAERLGTTKSAVAAFVSKHDIKSLNAAHGVRHTPRTIAIDPTPHAPRTPTKAVPTIDPAANRLFTSPLWLPLPGTDPILLEHHETGLCRWPVGLDKVFYCGQPADRHAPTPTHPDGAFHNYCPTHRAAGYRPLEPR